jgi:hypothetical protein
MFIFIIITLNKFIFIFSITNTSYIYYYNNKNILKQYEFAVHLSLIEKKKNLNNLLHYY